MREPAFWWRRAGLSRRLAGAAGARLWRGRGAAHGMTRRARRSAGAVRGKFHAWRRRQDADRHDARKNARGRRRASVLSQPRLWRQRRRSETGGCSCRPSPRKSATRRCCWRAWRRPSSRATASPAPQLARAQAPASSSWTMACRMLRWSRISRWPSSTDGAASAMAACFPAGPLRAPLDAQLARTDALLVVGEGDGADDVIAQLRAQTCRYFMAGSCPIKLRSRALKATQSAGLRRHRRSGQIFRHRCRGRHRVRRAPGLSRSSPLHRRGSRRTDHARPSTTGLRCSPPKRTARAWRASRCWRRSPTRAHTLPVTMVVEEADELRQLVLAKLRR